MNKHEYHMTNIRQYFESCKGFKKVTFYCSCGSQGATTPITLRIGGVDD